jgi:aspartate kinase
MLERGQIPILGGFVGATAKGETTTLGRGGSDTSAAVLGSVLDAEEIQIWTDVDGLMSADPRLVPEARPIPRLSFAEAAELAFYGAKVLHPDSLAPAVRRRIPVRVLNSMRPEAPGTVILDEAPASPGADVVSVASRPGVRAVRVSSPRMRADPEFAAGVLGSLSAQRVAPDLVVATEVAVDLVLSGKLDMPRLEERLGRHGEVAVREERAIICAVGSRLTEGSARRRALEALAEWEPELVGLGGSGVSVAAVIPTPRLSEAVRGLHRRFFEEARAG